MLTFVIKPFGSILSGFVPASLYDVGKLPDVLGKIEKLGASLFDRGFVPVEWAVMSRLRTSSECSVRAARFVLYGPSANKDIEAFAKYAAERMQYLSYQDKIEEALATACGVEPARPAASRLRQKKRG